MQKEINDARLCNIRVLIQENRMDVLDLLAVLDQVGEEGLYKILEVTKEDVQRHVEESEESVQQFMDEAVEEMQKSQQEGMAEDLVD